MSEQAANVSVAVVVLVCSVLAVWLWWSLRRAARGAECHAHSDGTVHSHYGGARAHVHPTWVERYDARVGWLFGEDVEVRR